MAMAGSQESTGYFLKVKPTPSKIKLEIGQNSQQHGTSAGVHPSMARFFLFHSKPDIDDRSRFLLGKQSCFLYLLYSQNFTYCWQGLKGVKT